VRRGKSRTAGATSFPEGDECGQGEKAANDPENCHASRTNERDQGFRTAGGAAQPRRSPTETEAVTFAGYQMDVHAAGAHAPVFVARNREISGESSSAAEPRYEG
jgi:hypothetical protein